MVKQEFELAYWQSKLGSLLKPRIPIVGFTPTRQQRPKRCLDRSSAWGGIENILAEIIERFNVKTDRCLEFGVEYGFSTVALSSFFDSVIGVDTFEGDRHTNNIQNIYQETVRTLAQYDNISLVRSNYQDFIRSDHKQFGLIHVDIIHTFADTYACGLWSAQHSQCTIFHDTESFPQVKQAVIEIARNTGKQFYNYEGSYGLGILV